MHVPGADHEVDALLLEPGPHRVVALLPGPVLRERERSCCDTGPLRPLEGGDVGHVRRNTGDGQAGVQKRLEVRPLAADEDADHDATTRPITVASPGSETTAQ